MNSHQPSGEQTTANKWLGRLILAAVFLWITGVTFFSHALVWTAEQLLLISGLNWPSWAWFIVSIAHGLALLLPTLALAAFWTGERERAIYRTWAIGALYILLMSPMRLVQPPAVIAANVLQIALTIFAIGLLLLLQFGMSRRVCRPRSNASIWLALPIAMLASYPWLMWGALGSLPDTLLNLLAALLFGLLAASILTWSLLRPLQNFKTGSKRGLILAGLTGMALLMELASAFGFGGLQLILIIVVPSFALAAASVYHFTGQYNGRGKTLPVAALVGIVAAAPSMLIDPDELALVLAAGGRDLLQWALYAAIVSAALGWLCGVLLVAFWPRVKILIRGSALRVTTVLSFFLGVLLYFGIGQSGFHGEQLFVIFEDQADVAPAASIDNIDARRAYVYESLVEHANLTQDDLRRTLDRLGIDYQPYYLVNGMVIEGGPLLRLWLSSRSDVDRVLINPVLRPLRAPSPGARGSAEPPGTTPWNLQLIGADRVWRDFGVTGEGIVIGQSDSGIDGKHPELRDSYRGRFTGDDLNWYDPWNNSGRPVDIGGHGTHTLGTILGSHTGVAPGAEWIGCTNLARNLANPALYLECMQFMLAPFPQDGDPLADGVPAMAADILSNSWGCPPIEGCDANALLDAARALRHAGLFVSVSAGNEGPFCGSVSDPLAIYDEVFSVGAIDQQGALAFFSSVGPVTADGSQRTKPDILAPGVSVLSAFNGATYEVLDGTSMAGPHLAGVVALMWSANPGLIGDIDSTEEILRETAREYMGQPPACGDQDELPFNGTGYGIVDAYSAVEAALALPSND